MFPKTSKCFLKVGVKVIFTFTSPKCHFSFTPSSLFWSPPSHLHIYPSFFIVHYSLLKCWRCLRGSCIISPSVWSASDIHEEEKQGDSTYSATKCPSSSPTFEWHQDSEEFDSSGMLTAKWLLARPSLAVFRGNSGEGGGDSEWSGQIKKPTCYFTVQICWCHKARKWGLAAFTWLLGWFYVIFPRPWM